MKNPFVFGEPVIGGGFIDRVQECERLKQYFLNSRNVILYSPRKFGKTSLVLKALDETGDEVIGLYIDCYAITSEKELARQLSKKVLSLYPEKEFIDALKRLFTGITPRVTLKTIPEVQIEVEFNQEEELMNAFELPERLAEDWNFPVVVVFDEFQELARFPHLMKSLRSIFQHHHHVSYVFIGSRQHMMEWIFQARESPFYNFGAHITLKELPKNEFKAFIHNALGTAGGTIPDECIDDLLALTRCHPHYTQRFCFELWYRLQVKGLIEKSDLRSVMGDVLSDLEDSYLVIWEALTTNQRKALLAVAKGERDLFSGEFIRRWDFASPASVQSALKKLIQKDVVIQRGDSHECADRFMEYWLTSRFLED
jgi:hypothetical protein